MRLLLLPLPMHSSDQIENIPPASPMTPAIINPGSSQSAQPPVITEKTWFEAFSKGYWEELQMFSKLAIYRVYRTNCKQTKCRPVALSTFYRRLRTCPHTDVGPKVRNTQVAQVDQANTGGASS